MSVVVETRARFLRLLLALLVSSATMLPSVLPVRASIPPGVAQEPAPPQPADLPVAGPQPAAQTIVEHWVGQGRVVEERVQRPWNPRGECWFCSFGVLTHDYEVDLLVYQDGTVSGTVREEFNLSYVLTSSQCVSMGAYQQDATILGCNLFTPKPSGSLTWHVTGRRYRNESLKKEYIEFESTEPSHDFEGIVTGCWLHYNGVCTPYYFKGKGQDVGLRDFPYISPPEVLFTIDTTSYGRPAVVFDMVLRLPNGYGGNGGYVLHNKSWRLFEVGTRPTLDLDHELLERSVFMYNVPLSNLFQARVNWSAVGGGSTRWTVDTTSEETAVALTPIIPRSFDVGALPVGPHPLRVYGRDTLGRNTNEENSSLVIAPLIQLCKDTNYTVSKLGATANYKCSFRLPDPALKFKIQKVPDWFPYLGGQPFGLRETQVRVDVEVKSTGEGNIKGLGQTGFEAMAGAVIGSLAFAGDVVLLPSGARIPRGSMEVALRGKITKEQPLVEIVPQFAAIITTVGKFSPAAGAYLKDLAKLGIEFEPKMIVAPRFKNEDGGDIEWLPEDLSVGAGLKVILSLAVMEDMLELQASVGGETKIVWTLPPDPNYFKSLDFKLAAAVRVLYWKFSTEGEKSYSWSYSGPEAMQAAAGDAFALLEPAADPTWTLIDRSYLSQPDYAQWVGKSFTETKPIDFALMNNAGPLAAPVLADDWSGATLVWSQERPGLPALGADELVFARGQVNDWSAPAAYLTNDDKADWNPQAITRSGGTLLVWQRMDTASPGDINANPAAFLGHTQIATAFLAGGATSLSPIQVLTSGSLNHRPQLAPTANGAIAVWVNNVANAMVGDTTSRDKLMFASYDQWTKTWSAPAVAVDNVPGVLDFAFSADGTQAAVLFLTGTDGNSATTADVELYSARYQNGVWAAPVRVTTNSVAESSPELTFVDGAPRGIWRAGAQLYFLSAWDQAPVALPFAVPGVAGNLQLRALGDGSLAMVWTEPEAGGQEMMFALFTPATGTWSQPAALPLPELGGTPAGYSAIENLSIGETSQSLGGVPGMMIAYTEAAVGTTAMTLPAFNGSTNVTTAFPQVPVLGKRTLRLAYAPLVTNLSITPADIVVTPATAQIGQNVTVSATVRNTGVYALQAVSLTLSSFATSNPAAVTVLGTQTIPVLGGGGRQTLAFTFPRPQVADRLYFLKVGTPAEANAKESALDDNVAYVGTDGLIVGTGPTMYAGAVASPLVVLSQQSALPAPVSIEVGLRLGTPSGPLLGTASVQVPVAAGQSVSVTVPVSATALGPGRHTVYFEVDPDGASGDWNPDNDIAGTTIVVAPDLTTLPLLAQQSDAIFRVWVRNQGNWPSPATAVAVYDRPPGLPGAVLVASVPVPALQSGQTVEVEGALPNAAAGAAASAATAYYALLDPQNQVQEISESNSFLLDTGGKPMAEPSPGSARIFLPIVNR